MKLEQKTISKLINLYVFLFLIFSIGIATYIIVTIIVEMTTDTMGNYMLEALKIFLSGTVGVITSVVVAESYLSSNPFVVSHENNEIVIKSMLKEARVSEELCEVLEKRHFMKTIVVYVLITHDGNAKRYYFNPSHFKNADIFFAFIARCKKNCVT